MILLYRYFTVNGQLVHRSMVKSLSLHRTSRSGWYYRSSMILIHLLLLHDHKKCQYQHSVYILSGFTVPPTYRCTRITKWSCALHMYTTHSPNNMFFLSAPCTVTVFCQQHWHTSLLIHDNISTQFPHLSWPLLYQIALENILGFGVHFWSVKGCEWECPTIVLLNFH
jgi:hypothetical protein